MKILLLGANGQVGWELRRSLISLGELVACDRTTADLEQQDNLAHLVKSLAPDIIVNAAAYTAVDRAETEVDKANLINAKAVGLLAKLAAESGAWLVHYSTDYVFNGAGQKAYKETDATSPLNIYGASKLAGEQAIVESGCQHLIFRTSWVYGAHGHNFVKTILRLGQERDELKIVGDQIGAPTGAELIADVTALALYRIMLDSSKASSLSGIYHLTASGETSWHGYAQYILNLAAEKGVKLKVLSEQVTSITTAEYPVPAKRPMNSRLDLEKIQTIFGVSLPHWQVGVGRVLSEIMTGVH